MPKQAETRLSVTQCGKRMLEYRHFTVMVKIQQTSCNSELGYNERQHFGWPRNAWKRDPGRV